MRNQSSRSSRDTKRLARSSSASTLGGVRAVEHRVAQLRRELAEHGDAFQEGAAIVVERREDLGAQVVGDEALVAAERGHRTGGVVDGPQPEAREHERCGPAFRALDQHVDLLVAQLELAQTHEQRVRLGRGKGEVARPQLGELSRRPQLGERERRVDPRADDHAHVLGHVEEGVIERGQAVLFGHGVEIVEHEDHRLSVPAEGAQQLVDGVLDRAPCSTEPTQRR